MPNPLEVAPIEPTHEVEESEPTQDGQECEKQSAKPASGEERRQEPVERDRNRARGMDGRRSARLEWWCRHGPVRYEWSETKVAPFRSTLHSRSATGNTRTRRRGFDHLGGERFGLTAAEGDTKHDLVSELPRHGADSLSSTSKQSLHGSDVLIAAGDDEVGFPPDDARWRGVQRGPRSISISMNEAPGSELGTAEIARHDDARVITVRSLQRSENRQSCCAGRLSIIVALLERSLGRTQPHGRTVMSGVVMMFANRRDRRVRVGEAHDAKRLCQEPRSLDPLFDLGTMVDRGIAVGIVLGR